MQRVPRSDACSQERRSEPDQHTSAATSRLTVFSRGSDRSTHVGGIAVVLRADRHIRKNCVVRRPLVCRSSRRDSPGRSSVEARAVSRGGSKILQTSFPQMSYKCRSATQLCRWSMLEFIHEQSADRPSGPGASAPGRRVRGSTLHPVARPCRNSTAVDGGGRQAPDLGGAGHRPGPARGSPAAAPGRRRGHRGVHRDRRRDSRRLARERDAADPARDPLGPQARHPPGVVASGVGRDGCRRGEHRPGLRDRERAGPAADPRRLRGLPRAIGGGGGSPGRAGSNS